MQRYRDGARRRLSMLKEETTRLEEVAVKVDSLAE